MSVRRACSTALLLAATAVSLGAQAAQAPATPTVAPTVAPRPPSGTVQVGDRIVVSVFDEPALSDTFTVSTGPSITMPGIGAIAFAGVRRDAVQPHLAAALARFLRDPVVTATTLVRVSVLGEVARPGYFLLHADALLSDAITEAGGPSPQAEMRKAQLSRRGVVLQDGPRLRDALAVGRTLDELGIQAGDELLIPRRADSERTIRILGLVVAIPLTILAITR